MERLPFHLFYRGRMIQKISKKRMPDVLHMHPYLMGSAGLKTDPQ